MKIVCASDTHNCFNYLNVPHGDVFVHAGDLTMDGDLAEVNRALTDIHNLKGFKYKVIIAGNHDFLFEKSPALIHGLLPDDIIYLQDSGITLDGINFYGMPWVPGLPRWAFSNRRIDWPGKLAQIPDDTNVLITHAPSFGIRDYVRPQSAKYGTITEGLHLGSTKLGARVSELKQLKAHIFGHIHDSSGVSRISDSYRVNAAICDEKYEPANPARIIRV